MDFFLRYISTCVIATYILNKDIPGEVHRCIKNPGIKNSFKVSSKCLDNLIQKSDLCRTGLDTQPQKT